MMRTTPALRIEYLADHPPLLPSVAQWQQREFGYLGAGKPVTLEQRIERLQQTMQKGRVPFALVALSPEGRLLGAASVLAATLIHRHLTPWLSTVVVDEQSRGRGIGSALSLRAAAEAAALGIGSLYLFTPDREQLYARLGWKTFDHAELNGLRVAIMAKPLPDGGSVSADSPCAPENSVPAAATR